MKQKTIGIIMIIVGVIYLLNLGFGLVEFLPDNIPIIGNIDEGVAGGLVLEGFRRFKK